AGVVWLVAPLVVSETLALQAQAPAIASTAQDQLSRLAGQKFEIFGFRVDLTSTTKVIESHANEFLLGQFGNAVSLGLAALGTLLQFILMLIVAFLVALDAPAITNLLRRLFPREYRSDFDQIWLQIKRMLYGYMRGQLLIAALIGLVSGLADGFLGLNYAVALGLLAGLTALVPYLGPFLGAIPAVLVGLAVSPTTALEVALVYLVISNVILNFVYPKVVGDAVRLPPILVIIAFIAGFSLAGILGMFIAVPIAATLRILFDHVYPRLYGQRA
ncbi:MAG TPA: AI-2E family transporter, partial [Candidatus Acidoferrales bacterium]|nr:AI-2E family transporter [Candidatus Acidoferrales bacterium]